MKTAYKIDDIGTVFEVDEDMKVVEHELDQTRDNKFFKLFYSPEEKTVFMHFRDTADDPWHITPLRFSRVPQVIRGLYSLREKYHRRK